MPRSCQEVLFTGPDRAPCWNKGSISMQTVIIGQILPFSSPFGHTDGTRPSTGTADAPTKSHLGAGMYKH